MARLVIFDEAVRGVDLPPHPVILGRSRKADIPIHDHLLSRKHCTIVPDPGGLHLVDLKSSNGTFLNGKRVERVRIKSEDVIEIGNTVIVLLESATWRRGKNLPRLRNPGKAKKLIQTLNKRGALARAEKVAPAKGKAPATRGERQAGLRQKRALTASEAAFVSWAETEFLKHPAARELIKEYLEHQIVATLVRNSTALRDLISAALEKVLVAGALVDDPRALEERIDDVVRHVASRGMLEAGPGSGDGAAGGRS
jgi:pSer/pThr/pTyr-binding forkhead associated (FHA) protein